MSKQLLVAFALLLASPSWAQDDFDARRHALTSLSTIFGELHHIRRMCDPDREGDLWRDQMKRLIDLEQPSFDLRDEMVGAFNAGYASAQDRFSFCDNDAEDYAAARAASGGALVDNLSAPLYAAARGEEDDSVDVVRGDVAPPAEPQDE